MISNQIMQIIYTRNCVNMNLGNLKVSDNVSSSVIYSRQNGYLTNIIEGKVDAR